MNKIQENKNFKEKVKDFWDKNKSKVITAGALVAGVVGTALTTVVVEKIGVHNDYKNGTDFTRYMMDKGYNAKEAEVWKQSALSYRDDTEKTLGIPLTEKWNEYRKDHQDEFVNW